MNGDFEVGATGTVTEVDGNRVYAFGHPFYQLGPTQFPMTRAHVLTVLPSLAASQKIASTGEVVGIVSAGSRDDDRRHARARPVDDSDQADAELGARHAQVLQHRHRPRSAVHAAPRLRRRSSTR